MKPVLTLIIILAVLTSGIAATVVFKPFDSFSLTDLINEFKVKTSGENGKNKRPLRTIDAVITLERTTCFGSCPAYSITIYGDGTVIYEGKSDVVIYGRQTTHISQEAVSELVEEFYDIGYFGLRDRYEASITDLPSTTTSILIDGQTKSVYNYFGAPEKLMRLEEKIDTTVNSQQWVQGG